MGLWNKVVKFLRSNITVKIGDDDAAKWNAIFGGGSATLAGTKVDERAALNTTTVLACVRLLSGTIGSLPCVLYQKKGDKRVPAENHPLYSVLKNDATDETTAMAFFETTQMHEELWGNRYAQILRKKSGAVYGLQLLMPDRTTVTRGADRRIKYTTTDSEGRQVTLDMDEVLHVPGLGFDGLVGKSPVGMMREAIGLAVASEEFGARFFGNGATMSGYLKHPGQLTPEALERLKKQWQENYTGPINAHKTVILEEAMDYQAISMPLKDTQFLEGRAFQATEIASGFGVPPTMIGLQDKTTAWGSGIEQLMLGFLIFSLRPRMIRIEQAMTRKLLSEKEKKEFYIKFNANALMRGDTKSRYEVYSIAKQNGILSTNDIRALEDLDPVESGDIYWRPANMAPADAPYDPKAAAAAQNDLDKNQDKKGDKK